VWRSDGAVDKAATVEAEHVKRIFLRGANRGERTDKVASGEAVSIRSGTPAREHYRCVFFLFSHH
jgi:hypothetical protein